MNRIDPPFANAAVRAVFEEYPPPLRAALIDMRALIFDVAAEADIGALTESLKWRQPAYRPAKPRTGTTVRIDAVRGDPRRFAIYFNCQSGLVDGFRDLYADKFVFEGDRAMVFSLGARIPRRPLKHCLALALTHHARAKPR